MEKHIVGVDVGGTKMYMLTEMDGKYIERIVPTGIQCTKLYIKEALNQFISELPFKVDAVGMALPGLIKNEDTLELSDVVPGLNGVTVDYFSEGQFEVKFINDVKAATLGEGAYYKQAHTVVVIMVGTGIAAGVIEQGRILQGANGFSGEIGCAHIPYKEGVESLDNLSSGAAILKKAGCLADELRKLLENGDEKAKHIIEEAGYYFGIGLGLMIQFYNPDVIVVGGGTSTYPGYMEVAKETAKRYTLPQLYESCLITEPRDIKRIVALGAIEVIS